MLLAWERNWDAYWDRMELGSRRSCNGHRCIGIEASRGCRWELCSLVPKIVRLFLVLEIEELAIGRQYGSLISTFLHISQAYILG